MEISEYIKRKNLISSEICDLLWKHDCVIIPGFGGFVGNYRSGHSHPVSHEFMPPSKQIAFNKNLQQDDGLLVSIISLKLLLEFNQTRLWIEETFQLFRERLNAGEPQLLNEIGEFRIDFEKNIVFNPDNSRQFLPQAYGLYTIQASPIQRISRELPKPPVNLPVTIPANRHQVKRPLKKLIVGLASLLVLVSIGLFSKFLPNDNSTAQLSFTPAVTASVEDEKQPVSAEKVSIEPVQNKPVVVFSPATAQIYIVAGCYSNGETALGRVEYLKGKGFDASILDVTPAGLYRVVYAGYNDILVAKSEMAEIVESLHEDAWLLVR